MERESPYYCLSRKFEPTNTFLDMVWCYSGLKINLIAFNREVTIIKYLKQDSIKPFLIVHLAALWALIYQIHLSRNTHLNKQILMTCLLNISDLHRPLQDPEGKGSAYWNGRWFPATLQVSCFVAMYFANYNKLPCIGKVLAVEEDGLVTCVLQGLQINK